MEELEMGKLSAAPPMAPTTGTIEERTPQAAAELSSSSSPSIVDEARECLAQSNGLARRDHCVDLAVELLLKVVVDNQGCFGHRIVQMALPDEFFLHVFFVIGVLRQEDLFDVFQLELSLR